MHSYLFSIIPFLYIFTKNREEVCLPHTICFMIGILILTFILNKALQFIFKDKDVTRLFLSLFWIAFWTIHPLARGISALFKNLPAFVLAYKWFLLLVFFTFTLVGLLFVLLKFRKRLTKLNQFLNVFSSLILGMIILNSLIGLVSIDKGKVESETATTVSQKKQFPNVYHILLDAYANKNTLKFLFKYDNSDFYNELTQKGFIYYPNSYSTYGGTLFSTTSMLNFGKTHEKLTESYLLTELKNNKVWKVFNANGFNIHLFSQTDLYCSKSFITNDLGVYSLAKSIMIFTQNIPIKHTVENLFLKSFYKQHIDEIYQIFSELKNGSKKYSFNNQYFYAHILNPHEPLVFDENGGIEVNQTFDGFLVQKQANIDSVDESYRKRYVNQIKAINKLTFDCIENILSQYPEDNQPIIILHGDHGRSLTLKDPMKYTLGNLFALYIPKSWREKAKDLTFNNLYRFISNQLFDTNYEYLSPRYFDGEDDITEEILRQN